MLLVIIINARVVLEASRRAGREKEGDGEGEGEREGEGDKGEG